MHSVVCAALSFHASMRLAHRFVRHGLLHGLLQPPVRPARYAPSSHALAPNVMRIRAYSTDDESVEAKARKFIEELRRNGTLASKPSHGTEK